MDLQILTPTGSRPGAFKLCLEWMSKQNYTGDVLWVIVDDGEEQSVDLYDFHMPNWQIKILRPEPFWTPGAFNTHGRNLLAGLEELSFDYPVVFIEDDDYYAPPWLSICSECSGHYELMGETGRLLYNVRNRTWQERTQLYRPNEPGAVLGSTVARGNALRHLQRIIHGNSKDPNPKLDYRLWASYRGESRVIPQMGMTVGIKGMPGRPNVMGTADKRLAHLDMDGDQLKHWIGPQNAGLVFDLVENLYENK